MGFILLTNGLCKRHSQSRAWTCERPVRSGRISLELSTRGGRQTAGVRRLRSTAANDDGLEEVSLENSAGTSVGESSTSRQEGTGASSSASELESSADADNGAPEETLSVDSEPIEGIPVKKKRTISSETREKISEALKGRAKSAEAKAKISESLKGRKKSAEHRRALSDRMSGENNPMYGRKLSEETKRRISESKRDPNNSKKKTKTQSASSEGATKTRRQRKPGPKKAPGSPKGPGSPKELVEEPGAEHYDELLKDMIEKLGPPKVVTKALKYSEENIQRQQLAEQRRIESICTACGGEGTTECPMCVGKHGIASLSCSMCQGVGFNICTHCDGSGVNPDYVNPDAIT